MTLIYLTPEAAIADRPFTDLVHTARDLQVLRFMATCAWLALEGEPGRWARHAPVQLHQPSSDDWVYRMVFPRPEQLLNHKHNPLTVVGFFGIKNAGADVALAQALDRQLIPELARFEGLLGYISLRLPTGNFANLVLFAAPEDKERWGASEKHNAAVRLLTPDYYAAVRIYNGRLPEGVAAPERLELDLVKYYDYGSHPLWRAVRELPPGVSR